MNKWKMVPVYPSTHKGVAKLLFGDPDMIRKELVKYLRLMANEARDMTGSYPADEAKEAKKRINKTVRALNIIIKLTPDRILRLL